MTNYELYILSPEWEEFRKAHPDPRCCVACGRRDTLELHHMHYPPNIWDTCNEDCCWLCLSCHRCFHRGLVAGRRQSYRLDGKSKEFTKAVIAVQRATEYYAPIAEILKNMTWKPDRRQMPAWMSRKDAQ